jgi:hypothetical protein
VHTGAKTKYSSGGQGTRSAIRRAPTAYPTTRRARPSDDFPNAQLCERPVRPGARPATAFPFKLPHFATGAS